MVIGTLNLSIGLYVLCRNRHGSMNQSFAFFAGSLSLWTWGLAFGRLRPEYYLPALQVAFAAGSLSAFGVLMFVEALPVPGVSRSRRRL